MRPASPRDTAGATRPRQTTGRPGALVVDEYGKEVGLISALDIASEVAKDARAWPWNRHEDGKVQPIAMVGH